MTYETQLTQIGQAADAEVASLTATIATQTANLAAKDVTIAQLNATILDLRAQLAAAGGGGTTPPPPPATGLPLIPFKPPVLTNPITIDATTVVNKGFVLDSTKDYIIQLPKTSTYKNTAGISIAGGRNIVIIGGVVDVGNGNNGVRRAAYFKDVKGTVHLEGVRFGSSAGVNLTEGINISAPDAVIHIANCHISTRTDGSQATNHADTLQTWNGPKTLRVFGFKAKSNYQAMFLNARDTNTSAQPIEGSWTMDRIDVEVTVPGGYTLWLVPPPGFIKMGSKVHAYGGKGLWKPEMWTKAITGGGVITSAPTEDFVPTAGNSYVSPGYV